MIQLSSRTFLKRTVTTAVLNGVVLLAYFNQLRETGRTVLQAVQEGAERRMRPDMKNLRGAERLCQAFLSR